ncbi:MAG: hypothetical protein ACTSUE_27755 [Promethearchaeota archaeon]
MKPCIGRDAIPPGHGSVRVLRAKADCTCRGIHAADILKGR